MWWMSYTSRRYSFIGLLPQRSPRTRHLSPAEFWVEGEGFSFTEDADIGLTLIRPQTDFVNVFRWLKSENYTCPWTREVCHVILAREREFRLFSGRQESDGMRTMVYGTHQDLHQRRSLSTIQRDGTYRSFSIIDGE